MDISKLKLLEEQEINGVKVKFMVGGDYGFNEFDGVCWYSVLVVLADDNSKHTICTWQYDETCADSGIYDLDERDPNQEDADKWLADHTGCDIDDAHDIIEDIKNYADDRVFLNGGDELENIYENEELTEIVGVGISYNSIDAEIYKSESGRYIGVIEESADITVITEFEEDVAEKISKKADEYERMSLDRWFLAYNAIMKNSGNWDDDDFDADMFEIFDAE